MEITNGERAWIEFWAHFITILFCGIWHGACIKPPIETAWRTGRHSQTDHKIGIPIWTNPKLIFGVFDKRYLNNTITSDFEEPGEFNLFSFACSTFGIVFFLALPPMITSTSNSSHYHPAQAVLFRTDLQPAIGIRSLCLTPLPYAVPNPPSVEHQD